MICADEYRTVVEAVEAAIYDAILGSPAILVASEYRHDAVADALALEAEGCDDEGVFWGVDFECGEWSVALINTGSGVISPGGAA